MNSLLYPSRHAKSFPRTHNSLSIMRSPSHRATQLLKAFADYFYEEFKEEWIAPQRVAETEPNPTTLSVFEEATKEYNAFLDFNKKHSTSTSANSSCQCELIEKGNQHVLSNDIPHSSYTFNCDCGKSITPLVPTKTNDTEMTYDVHND